MRREYTLEEFFIEHKANAQQRKKFTEVLVEEQQKYSWMGKGMAYEDLCLLWVNTMY